MDYILFDAKYMISNVVVGNHVLGDFIHSVWLSVLVKVLTVMLALICCYLYFVCPRLIAYLPWYSVVFFPISWLCIQLLFPPHILEHPANKSLYYESLTFQIAIKYKIWCTLPFNIDWVESWTKHPLEGRDNLP